jgi:hypothetical protein
MRNSFAFAALVVLSFAVMPTLAPAQTFEKKNYNYSANGPKDGSLKP